MLELLGSGYVMDHCIAAYAERQQREIYKVYMADLQYALVKLFSKNIQDVFPRYYDLIHPKKKDERTGEEIAAEIIAKHGLKVVG